MATKTQAKQAEQETTNRDAARSDDGRSTDLRDSPMMAHLLDALEDGTDIGHYGRLTFAMVARHFLSEQELVKWLAKDKSIDEGQARTLAAQVNSRDYNPPKREKILEWQKEQDFQIIANPDDPDAGNVYRDLKFPDNVYQDIAEYHEQKAEATT